MILGDICTRKCGFCNIKSGRPRKVDNNEPFRLAEVIKKLNLKHVVITSVDRDDLKDGGALQFKNSILSIKKSCPSTTRSANSRFSKEIRSNRDNCFCKT